MFSAMIIDMYLQMFACVIVGDDIEHVYIIFESDEWNSLLAVCLKKWY